MPGLIERIRVWFRDYKTPDGKPQNRFAFNDKPLNKEFTMQVWPLCAIVMVTCLRGYPGAACALGLHFQIHEPSAPMQVIAETHGFYNAESQQGGQRPVFGMMLAARPTMDERHPECMHALHRTHVATGLV